MSSNAAPGDGETSTPRRRLVVRVLRVVLAAAGLAFLVVTLADTWSQSSELLRSPVRLVTAFAIVVVALMLWARAWSALLAHEADTRALRHGFYLSQLGKYVPGGIWQAAGLVTLGRDAGADLARASTAFFVLAATQVAGAATVGGLAALFTPDLPTPFRVAAIASLLLALLVHRGWMVMALRLARRVVKRLDVNGVPSQRAILESYAFAAVATAVASAAFALITRPHDAGVALAALSAFATAWWIGFVAIPFPSGIGIREAVLLAALRTPLTTAVVLGAAIGQRLVSIAAEATLIGATGTHRLRLHRRRTRG